MVEVATHRGTLIRAPIAAACAGLVVYVGWLLGAGRGGIDAFASDWLYNGILLCAALACLIRAAVDSRERGAWLAFGIGLTAWTAGDVYWDFWLSHMRKEPYPSWADAGYLAFYPCAYVGLLLLVRGRVRGFNPSAWLDGAIGLLGCAALVVAVLAPALVGLVKGDLAVVITNLAYPLGDLLLLAFLAGALMIAGTRGGVAWAMIGVALLTWGIADAIYLYQTAAGTYAENHMLDALWPVGALAIALGAVAPTRLAHRRRPHTSIVFPATFALLAVGVLALDHFDRQHEAAVWLAAGTLAAIVLRLVLTFRENRRLLWQMHSEALSDPLTGLGNRRALLRDLESTLAQGDPTMFGLFDLDGFKAYNDSFGHPAGDGLLRRLGANLEAAVAPDGAAYRLGGDEFCILLPNADGRAEVGFLAATEALKEYGEGFSIGSSSGSAMLPREAADPSEVMRLADRRMYAAKGMRSESASRQTHDLMVRVLREREPELSDHQRGVARLAREMGRRLGFDAEQLDVLTRAAELHDVGKIAIPDRILHKEGPLDDVEWSLMKTHTLIGERILGVAPAMRPVARMVRSSHERWDGAGYPDGVPAAEVSLGSRVIFICDAYDAMTNDRPYRHRMTHAEALAELRRNAGTQFDPQLVELFADVGAWAVETRESPGTEPAYP